MSPELIGVLGIFAMLGLLALRVPVAIAKFLVGLAGVAILTQQSIGRLFLAGVLPGLVLVALFILTILILTTINPALGPCGPRTSWAEKGRATFGSLPLIGLVCVTIGGIYGELFSPTEAAGVGALSAILYGLGTRTLSLRRLSSALTDSVSITAVVMLILIAAHVFGPFLALSHVPTMVGEALAALPFGSYGIMLMILATNLVLGCFMEGYATLVLTMPIFFPVITGLGFDPIWFGVVVVVMPEIGLITPPVGINVFIVKSVAPEVPLSEIFWGVAPFLLALAAVVGLLILWPWLALYLPNTMLGAG
jgi:tripartite ATP-independent transporter DctM subunit